jgi:hypothetical protein
MNTAGIQERDKNKHELWGDMDRDGSPEAWAAGRLSTCPILAQNLAKHPWDWAKAAWVDMVCRWPLSRSHSLLSLPSTTEPPSPEEFPLLCSTYALGLFFTPGICSLTASFSNQLISVKGDNEDNFFK